MWPKLPRVNDTVLRVNGNHVVFVVMIRSDTSSSSFAVSLVCSQWMYGWMEAVLVVNTMFNVNMGGGWRQRTFCDL